jgi:hypothetical protein
MEVNTAMLKKHFSLIIIATICSLMLGGCYFANGIKYEEPAFRRTLVKSANPYTIEINTHPWHTGNAHMPFDFTVYEYDDSYEIGLPKEVGNFSKNDIELKACGVSLVVLAATVEVNRDLVKFDIEYNFKTGPSPQPIHLVGEMRLVEANAVPRTCKHPTFYVRPVTPNESEVAAKPAHHPGLAR